jgi:hypothetical protein
MRTTLTLEPDVEAILRRLMKERSMSMKEAVNHLIRQGALGRHEPFRTRTASLGVSTVNLDRALQLVGDLEDDERVSKMRRGS